jgi:hypothetical protein
VTDSAPRRSSLWTPMDRRRFLRAALAATAGGAAIYAVGCGDDDDGQMAAGTMTPAPSTPGSPAGSGITPVLLTSEFVAGQGNRFVVGILDEDRRLLRDADVHARFFTVAEDGTTGTFRGEGGMEYVELNVEGAHIHGGTLDLDEGIGFYVLNTPFDAAGPWAVELNAIPREGDHTTVQVPFTVLEDPNTPGIGEVPPASENDTFDTNPNLQSLCSRDPACPLHDRVIADLLDNGRPLVVQFSTPAFCATRFCGPVLDVLLERVPEYEDRIDFVHIEVWQDFQVQAYRRTMTEWNLRTEPYTFFMDSSGRVVLKLESVFSEENLDEALAQLATL